MQLQLFLMLQQEGGVFTAAPLIVTHNTHVKDTFRQVAVSLLHWADVPSQTEQSRAARRDGKTQSYCEALQAAEVPLICIKSFYSNWKELKCWQMTAVGWRVYRVEVSVKCSHREQLKCFKNSRGVSLYLRGVCVCVCAGADHRLVHRLPVSDPGVLPGLPGGEGRCLHGRVQPWKPHRSAQTAGLRHLRRRSVVGAGTYTTSRSRQKL